MAKSNIVFMVHNLNSGGIENYLLRYLLDTHKSFKEIYVYCRSGHGGQLEDEFLSIPNVIVLKHKVNHLNILQFLKFSYFLKNNSISIICDFTGNFSGPILFIGRLRGINKRVAFYRSSSDRFKKGFTRNAYNSLSNFLVRKYATDILSNSNAGFTHFFGSSWVKDTRFAIIRNGINASTILNETENLRFELNIPKNAFVVGHIGRFNEAKNHAVIISVAEALIKQYDDIYFILCGNGVKKSLYNKVATRNLLHRVFLFENRNDIPKVLNTLDCFIFPSLTEGQPNALIEALICGIKCVTSNIDSIKETVPIGHTDQFEPYDLESFINAITDIYQTGSRKNYEIQREMIEKFSHTKNFSEFTSKLL